VTVPKGTAHLPADRIEASSALASTALAANHYVEEAMRWLPEGGTGYQPVPPGDSPGGTGRDVSSRTGAKNKGSASPIPVGGSPTGAGESPAPPLALPPHSPRG
ncbi:MAG: hypothetical protein ABIQ35_11885, partial [Verrucomicrobiota bacterium]